MALILREMSTRYGRSPGGYVWAVLEPLGAILVLSFGFALLIRTPSLGTSFILFYATGFLPFSLYQTLSNTVARSIVFSRALLFYPAVTWMDALIARFSLNALTGVLITYLLLVGILIVSDVRVVINMEVVIEAMLLTMVLGLGIGVLNCALMGLFPIWDVVWSIATRPLFIVSGVLFLYEDLPANVQAILWWNPLLHIIGLMRSGFYSTYSPDYVSIPFVVGIGLICMTMGLILLKRHYRTILNN